MGCDHPAHLPCRPGQKAGLARPLVAATCQPVGERLDVLRPMMGVYILTQGDHDSHPFCGSHVVECPASCLSTLHTPWETGVCWAWGSTWTEPVPPSARPVQCALLPTVCTHTPVPTEPCDRPTHTQAPGLEPRAVAGEMILSLPEQSPGLSLLGTQSQHSTDARCPAWMDGGCMTEDHRAWPRTRCEGGVRRRPAAPALVLTPQPSPTSPV